MPIGSFAFPCNPGSSAQAGLTGEQSPGGTVLTSFKESTAMSIRKFTIADAPLERMRENRDVVIGDVIGQESDSSISVGYCRYAPDQSMEYTVTYDEVLVITKGRFSIRTNEREVTAGPGEVLYIDRGTSLVYASHDEGAEMVYVTHPRWK
jgi:ethanolamine utilization protein EutQ (cupin superfamily)